MHNYFIYRKCWRFDGAPHEEPKLQKEEKEALLKQGGWMVRNTFDFDCHEETCFWYIIKDSFGGLDELSSRVRNKIRHAFSYFEYQPICYETMWEKTYPIIAETFADYPIHDRRMNQEVYEQYLIHCKERTTDYWGIFEKTTGQMVGFCTVNIWEDCSEYGVTGILSQYKRNGYYPFYGLYHYLNEYYLKQQHFKYVSDSARSITEHSNIHDFLIQNFNFRKAYCKLEVHYCWWMKIAVKMLYPFRKIIPLPRIKAILNMEAMQRGEK